MDDHDLTNSNPNALILPPRKPKLRRNAPEEATVRPLSKRARRKLDQLNKKAVLQTKRKLAAQGLRKSALSRDDSQSLHLLQALLGNHKPSDRVFLCNYNCLVKLHASIPSAIHAQANAIKQKLERCDDSEDDEDNEMPEDSSGPQDLAPEPSSLSNEVVSTVPTEEMTTVNVDETSPAVIVDRPWTEHLQRQQVIRSRAQEETRTALPAGELEQEIVDAVLNNETVLITGGTGCGKSTQVPQFLYEAGMCLKHDNRLLKIGVTQPRRVAAIAVANRVREEMGDHGSYVAHQVRFSKSADVDKSRVLVMTDGILLKMLQSDFLLQSFSVIVLDEAHERSINNDLLLGLLTRSLFLRRSRFNQNLSDLPPLRLVVMSATLKVCDYVDNPRLFSQAPCSIHIPARAHPVSVHFNQTTPQDYLFECSKKIRQINSKLPAGSILVFLTGRNEIHKLADYLNGGRSRSYSDDDGDSEESSSDDNERRDVEVHQNSLESYLSSAGARPATEATNEAELIENAEVVQNADVDVFSSLPGIERETKGIDADGDAVNEPIMPNKMSSSGTIWLGAGFGSGTLRVIPLYANVSPANQAACFENSSAEERTVILATNVAETSITLPNIRYVIDCGFEKRRVYSSTGATSKFSVVQISKASADQRAGRAGRVGPGHCYRLYSSAVFDAEFATHPPVQILGAPLDSTLLLVGSMGLPRVDGFPFPTPPPQAAIEGAVSRLEILGLISKNQNKGHHRLTNLGELTVHLPLLPRYALMVIRSLFGARKTQHWYLLPSTALAAACLSVGSEIFSCRKAQHTVAVITKDDLDDYMGSILGMCRATNREAFCAEKEIVIGRAMEVTDLALHILRIMSQMYLSREETAQIESWLGRPLSSSRTKSGQSDSTLWFKNARAMTDIQAQAVRFCVTLGLVDHVAVRLIALNPSGDRAAQGSLSSKEYKRYRKAYQSVELQESKLAFIPLTSSLYQIRPWPSAIVYNNLVARDDGSFTLRDIVRIDSVERLRDSIDPNLPGWRILSSLTGLN